MDPTPQTDQPFQVRAFFREFGIQVGVGVPILRALEACGKLTRDVELRQAIVDMQQQVSEGELPSAVMARYPSLFSAEQQARFAKGEETGDLDLVASELANQTNEDFSILVNKALNRKPDAIVFLQELGELLEPSDVDLESRSDDSAEEGWRPPQTFEDAWSTAMREAEDPANEWKRHGQEPEPDMSAQELASLVRKAGLDLSDSGKEMVEQIAQAVEKGSTFRDALARYPEQFDEVILNVVESGEVGKVLGLVLKKVV